MSSKILQNLIFQFNEVIESKLGIVDNTGTIVACYDLDKVGQSININYDFIHSKEQSWNEGEYYFKKINIKNKLEYIAYIESQNEECINSLSLFVISISNIKTYYDEKFDKHNFVKNIILDNVLPGDIQLRAKDLHIDYEGKRIAFLIKTDSVKDIYAFNVIQSLFPNKSRDFVILVDDENTALIKELKPSEDDDEIKKKAKVIIDTLNTELMVKASIGIGTVADNLRDVARSYKEAHMALLVGEIFENDKSIIDYNKLGIGRLIYQLPTTLCKLFLKEVFDEEITFESFDKETMITIQKFFENNLNVSETSRQLFVHRNTLVYRLDKIQKLTGMDLRKFDDAIHFKVAMLVKRYLEKTHNV